jgi:hypothetical protein
MKKLNSFRVVWGLGTILCFCVAAPAWAKGKAGGGSGGGSSGGGGGTATTTVDVTSVIHDLAADSAQLLLASDDYYGGDQAPYSGSLNANVISQIDDTGRWFFYLNGQKQGVRTIWITPNEAIDGTVDLAAPPAGYYWKNVEAHSRCFDSSFNTIPFQTIRNSETYCTLSVDFNWNGTVYKLHMSPQQPAGASPAPDTGLATVTCNSLSSDGSQCVSWTIVPNMSAPHAGVANLYSYWGARGKSGWTFIGQYYNIFRIDVTNP